MTTPKAPSRRAFTVIEVVLAGVIGTIVVATAVGLLASLDKTDRRLDVRHRQEVQLARTRTTFQHAMTSLVMEDQPQAGFQPDETTGVPAKPLPPPRFSLHTTDSPGALRVFRMARLKGLDLGEPQRLEVVVDRPPRPLGSNLEHELGLTSAENADQNLGASLVASADRSAHRGTFELWPDGTLPATREAERAWLTTGGMTLWWIPSADGAIESEVVPGAVPFISGLVSCQWRVFQDKEQKHNYESTWVVDLPSYVEFECRTTAGIHVNWMFEVMWTEGPEFAAAQPGLGGADDEETGEGRAEGRDGAALPGSDDPNRGITPITRPGGGGSSSSPGGGRDQ
jgi:hypothetical protein